ncbi:MAG: hypothetical protein JWL77_3539 [Chthonomonadaceae bacterium]|nr:hypothetical protein [Chthonomonadaceae bacterium]
MQNDLDHFAVYYADKLWHLLPAIYRERDARTESMNGPLREMVNRLGIQAAILHRSLDRLWDDQSIETCDDWVVPYIADLLAARLPEGLDADGQRLDVARTLAYRRRKGTMNVVEQTAHDVTGWHVHAVEFFRHLGRTRHLLDPSLSQQGETETGEETRLAQGDSGLVRLSGGWADLRNRHRAACAQTAFDTFAHTPDFRAGRGSAGWHQIGHLGLFVWRLHSVHVGPVTPLPVVGHPGHFTVDPRGRDVPLFSRAARIYAEEWERAQDWQMPGPLTRAGMQQSLTELYAQRDPETDPDEGEILLPHTFALFLAPDSQSDFALVERERITASAPQFRWETAPGAAKEDLVRFLIDPERGRIVAHGLNESARLRAVYHIGIASRLGAGSWERRVLDAVPPPVPDPETLVTGGGGALAEALTEPTTEIGAFTIGDSLTYDAVRDLPQVRELMLRAGTHCRPLVLLPSAAPAHRPPSRRREKPIENEEGDSEGQPVGQSDPEPDVSRWVFTGIEAGELTLDGLWVSGGDIVLRGSFARVTLTSCTLDPGDLAETPPAFRHASDGRELRPCVLRIEGEVGALRLERCLLGPIRVGEGGDIETLTLQDCVVQALDDAPAIAQMSGALRLQNCTVLGRICAHRIYGEGCLCDDIVEVRDRQQGYLQYSALPPGSRAPDLMACVEIPVRAPLFTSRAFGQPGYAQLAAHADSAMLAATPGATLTGGGREGVEIGAFAREKTFLKARALTAKLEEYLPLGLTPVVIAVT